MNELLYNFLNEIEDVNKIKEISVDEFTKIVKANKLISEKDAKMLIESFKKIADKKNSEEDTSSSDQRKKKYREQSYNNLNQDIKSEINNKTKENKESKEKDDSIER